MGWSTGSYINILNINWVFVYNFKFIVILVTNLLEFFWNFFFYRQGSLETQVLPSKQAFCLRIMDIFHYSMQKNAVLQDPNSNILKFMFGT